MYPTVVILLVETPRSMTDVWEISPVVASEAHPATLGQGGCPGTYGVAG